MVNRFATRTAERRRTELLDAAADILTEQGWSALRMQTVADRVGVSRQTLYNEFGSKEGLTNALALRSTELVLDRVDEAVTDAPTVHAAWQRAITAALDAARADPVMAAGLGADDNGTFVRQFVGTPAVFALAQRRLAATFGGRWPDLAGDDLAVAVEAAIRLAISHILLPLHQPAVIARHTARLLAAATSQLPPVETPVVRARPLYASGHEHGQRSRGR